MHASSIKDFVAVKRLHRYLKGTLDHGLVYQSSSLILQAFSDSNWAGDCLDHKSSSSYYVFLGDNLISQSTNKQTTVPRSSTEAKYRSLAHIATKLSWLQMLLQDLHIDVTSMPILWCDNTSAIALATTPIFHAHSKHIEVYCHYIRDRVAANAIALRYIPTSNQLKALPISCFQFLKAKLLVLPTR